MEIIKTNKFTKVQFECLDENDDDAIVTFHVQKDGSQIYISDENGNEGVLNTDIESLTAIRDAINDALIAEKPYATLELDKDELYFLKNLAEDLQEFYLLSENPKWKSIADKIEAQVLNTLQ